MDDFECGFSSKVCRDFRARTSSRQYAIVCRQSVVCQPRPELSSAISTSLAYHLPPDARLHSLFQQLGPSDDLGHLETHRSVRIAA